MSGNALMIPVDDSPDRIYPTMSSRRICAVESGYSSSLAHNVWRRIVQMSASAVWFCHVKADESL